MITISQMSIMRSVTVALVLFGCALVAAGDQDELIPQPAEEEPDRHPRPPGDNPVVLLMHFVNAEVHVSIGPEEGDERRQGKRIDEQQRKARP